MDDFFLSLPISESKNICISPVADRDLTEAWLQDPGDGCGLFIYETSAENPCEQIEVLGKVADIEAAEELARVLAIASAALRLNRLIE